MKGKLTKTDNNWELIHFLESGGQELIPLHPNDIKELNEWITDYPNSYITPQDVFFHYATIGNNIYGELDRNDYPNDWDNIIQDIAAYHDILIDVRIQEYLEKHYNVPTKKI